MLSQPGWDAPVSEYLAKFRFVKQKAEEKASRLALPAALFSLQRVSDGFCLVCIEFSACIAAGLANPLSLFSSFSYK